MSAIMSDMKALPKPAKKKPRAAKAKALPDTFTVRDLNRQPAAILRACDELGSVRIRTRDGRAYELRNAQNGGRAPGAKIDFDAHWRRLREAGCRPPTAAEMKRIDRITAGEI